MIKATKIGVTGIGLALALAGNMQGLTLGLQTNGDYENVGAPNPGCTILTDLDNDNHYLQVPAGIGKAYYSLGGLPVTHQTYVMRFDYRVRYSPTGPAHAFNEVWPIDFWNGVSQTGTLWAQTGWLGDTGGNWATSQTSWLMENPGNPTDTVLKQSIYHENYDAADDLDNFYIGPADSTAPGAVSGAVATGVVKWTNPGDPDFVGALIVRSSSPLAWTPTDGVSYFIGDSIGGGTVVHRAGDNHSAVGFLPNLGSGGFYGIWAYDGLANYAAGAFVMAPEPSALALLALSVPVLLRGRRRRSR